MSNRRRLFPNLPRPFQRSRVRPESNPPAPEAEPGIDSDEARLAVVRYAEGIARASGQPLEKVMKSGPVKNYAKRFGVKWD